MFSDQPIERYNPVGDADVEHREEFRKRLDFWSHELLRASQDEKWVCTTLRAAQRRFAHSSGTLPQCLDRVFLDLSRAGVVVSEDELFREATQQTSWLGWLASWVSVAQAKSRRQSVHDVSNSERFVFRARLDEMAEAILRSCTRDDTRPLFSELTLQQTARKLCRNEDDAELVVRWILGRQLVMHHGKDGPLLKRTGVGQLTEEEESICELQFVVDKLLQHEHDLSQRSAALLADIKTCLREKNRVRATALLKRKKIVDGELAKRTEVCTNVQQVLMVLEGAKANKMAFQALKTGTQAMEHLREKAGLSVEAIEEVFDQFTELKDEQEEISNVLSEERVQWTEEELKEMDAELSELAALDVEKIVSKPAITNMNGASSGVFNVLSNSNSNNNNDANDVVDAMSNLAIAEKPQQKKVLLEEM